MFWQRYLIFNLHISGGVLGILAAAIIVSGCAHESMSRHPPTAGHCGITDVQIERVRAISIEIVKRGFAPGVNTLVLCDGVPVIATTEGLADAARNRPLHEDDLFRIYSMTKPLTSLAAMILIEDKRLGLDDDVSKYLTHFANTRVFVGGDSPSTIVTVAPIRAVTIRDLLRHTAGLTYVSPIVNPVHQLYVLKGIDNGAGPTLKPGDGSSPLADIAEFTKRLSTIPLLHQPGARFSYGNATDVLGHVIEIASGQSLEAFMQDRVFRPLGMHDTFFTVPAGKVARLTGAYAATTQSGVANRILRNDDTTKLTRSPVALVEDPRASLFAKRRFMNFGGAGVVSTTKDYQKFLQAMLNLGTYRGARIISAASVAEMTRNQLSVETIKNSQLGMQGLGFGLGFATFEDNTKLAFAVPTNGYFWGGAASTYFWVDPDRNVSGVVMAQVFGGDVMPFYVEMLNTLYAPPSPPDQ